MHIYCFVTAVENFAQLCLELSLISKQYCVAQHEYY